MKKIGLMITYNEEHFIKYSLPNLLRVVDEVIILDNSTDNTREYLGQFSNVYVYDEVMSMSYKDRRQFTIDKGREHFGTHFICIDADEILSEELITYLNVELPKLPSGMAIGCLWTHVSSNLNYELDNFDCKLQALAWHDNSFDNLNGQDLIHEDKTPYGHPISNPKKYIITNERLFHFGGCNSNFLRLKKRYYHILEYRRDLDQHTCNLRYLRNIDENVSLITHGTYPENIDNGIISNFNPTDKFLEKIKIEFVNNWSDEFYSLDVWRDIEILQIAQEVVKDFNYNRVVYKDVMSARYLHLLLNWNQVKNLVWRGEFSRIYNYLMSIIIWKIKNVSNRYF
jgi:hypothetical protein